MQHSNWLKRVTQFAKSSQIVIFLHTFVMLQFVKDIGTRTSLPIGPLSTKAERH